MIAELEPNGRWGATNDGRPSDQLGRARSARRGSPGLTALLIRVFRVLLLTAVLISTEAATWKVEQNGTGNFTTIQAAVDAAEPGDTIEIGPGFYQENVFIRQSVSIRGVGPQFVTIQGTSSHILELVAAVRLSEVNLSGLTLNGSGWGVVVRGSYRVTVSNCVLSNGFAGGIYVETGSSATLTHCTIAGHQRYGVQSNGGSVSLDNCILAFNTQHLASGGIGVHVVSVFSPDTLAVTPTFPPVVSDPQFVDAPRGNYALKEGSRLRNKGRPGALDPDGTVADLGAFGGPDAAAFWPYPDKGPIVRSLTLEKVSARQGDTIKIKASATTR